MHRQALRVAKWVDLFKPNDIALLENEYTKLRSKTKSKNRSVSSIKMPSARNLHIKNKGMKFIRDKIAKDFIKKAINTEFVQRNDKKEEQLKSIQTDNSFQSIHMLPSVKNIKKTHHNPMGKEIFIINFL